MAKGYVSMVLHAHLPFVRHPEYNKSLEEHWLFEAMTETYIPLLQVFEGLVQDGVDFRITMSLTPPLLSMMADPLLQERYERYLGERISLSKKEITRTRDFYEISEVPKMYLQKFEEIREFYHAWDRDLVKAFRTYQDLGKLEILASPATHGFFPLMETQRECIQAQVEMGVSLYKEYFHRSPRGMWLAECGYTPVVDDILKRNGILYFIMESHGVLYAHPRPVNGTYAPICTPSGVAAFGRDMESSKQVWSADEGYPGDFYYRDFYRDIGYELDPDYLDSCLVDGHRMHTGLKYYRITGKTEDKHAYQPQIAMEKAAQHAGNFMFNREHQIHYLSSRMDQPPIVVCPYDAELFGHWWYEGPQWIDFLFRKIYYDQGTFTLITPGEYLFKYPQVQVARPTPSSWGYQGYNEVWLNGSNDWIYPHLHHAGSHMIKMANRFPYADGLLLRALNQAARELMLAQSSDWAFIMKTGTMVEYACNRTKAHIGRFEYLMYQIEKNSFDEQWIEEIEYLDNIFPHIHYSLYQSTRNNLHRPIENLALA